jgi:hypothetical protein
METEYVTITEDAKTYEESLRNKWSTDLPEKPSYQELKQIVQPRLDGAELERVNVFWNGEYLDMFVDETGLLKGLPVNEVATRIYHNNMRIHNPLFDGPWPPICGPAVLFLRKVWF